MLALLVLFSSAVVSGLALETRLPFNDLPRRLVAVLTIAAAQLLLSIQALSLATRLTGAMLLAANLLFTSLVVALIVKMESNRLREPWSLLLRRALREARQLHSPTAWTMLAVAVAAVTTHCVVGALVSFGDSYHREMPAFWRQHRTIAPFPASNPRLVAVSFLAEALSLPGYLYPRTPVMLAVWTWLAALFTLMLVFALARRLGAGVAVAATAAALTAGYSVFMLDCRDAHAAAALAGMWFGASLLFLFSVRSPEGFWANFGGAVGCFCMACGAKNSTMVLAPVVMALGVMVIGRSLLTRHAVAAALWAAVFGLLASGVLWNYAQNVSWFGDPRGPEFLRRHLAGDFQPRSIWTRWCRGVVLLAGDTIWLPRSLEPSYRATGKALVRWLGGRDLIRDDDPPCKFAGLAVGFNFDDAAITPRKGLGLAGLFFFLPGLVLAAWRCVRGGGDPAARRTAGGLLMVAVGVFLVSHLVLRWQALGLLRLTPAFVVAGAPLAALALERKAARALALVVLALSVAALSLYCLGTAARGLPSICQLPGWVTRLQHEHQRPVQIEWPGRAPENLVMKEDYTQRELYERLWCELPEPTVAGLVGGYDSECYFLFGAGFANRVVSLCDSRAPGMLREPPADLEVLVLADYSAEREAWALARHFEPIFRVLDGGSCVFGAFKRPVP